MSPAPTRLQRLLINTLAVLVTLLLLPGQGRVRCMLEAGADGCCCAAATDSTLTGQSTCCRGDADEAPTPAEDGDEGGRGCGCTDPDEDPTTAPGHEGGDDPEPAARPLPCLVLACAPIDAGDVRAKTSWTRRPPPTGPPLHLRLGVLLI